MSVVKPRQQIEIAAALTAITLLGIIAIWGGRVFYPLWLICVTIHLCWEVENYNNINRDNPIVLTILHILFYTTMSPFYLLMSGFLAAIMMIDIYLENKKVRKENERKT